MKIVHYDGKVKYCSNWGRDKPPPACADCKHICDGQRCNRATEGEAFNLITGKLEKLYSAYTCSEQRYSKSVFDCGLVGRYFEPK